MHERLLLSAKILVVGGWSQEGKNPPLEIIDLINTKSKSDIVEDKNGSRGGATGGILQDQLLICGGHGSNGNSARNISIIREPNYCGKMIYPRRYMSSVVLNESIIWATGGMSNNGQLKSTEIVSFDQPVVPGPDLKFTVSHHSMVLVNPRTIYLLGGYQDGETSDKTWIIDPTNDFQIKDGPSFNIARREHSCAKMRIKEKIFLVVAGGKCCNNTTLDSVELLDTTCPDQGWKIGMKLNYIFRNI